jgi:hypothetical protein
MSSAVKSIRSSDISTVPYRVNKQFTFESSSFSQNGIIGYLGYLETGSALDQLDEHQLIYYSIRQLYYGGEITSSILIDNTSGSHYDNYQQSTAASGTFEYEIKNFPTENRSEIRALSIPQSLYGEKLKPSTFILQDNTGSYYIVDDSNGNLFDIISLPNPYVVNGEIQSNYFENVNINALPKVGNVFYAHGIAVITNQDYQSIFPKDCTLEDGYVYYPSPSPTPSISISNTPSVSVTPSISISNTPSVSVTPSISISNTPSVSVTPSISISNTPSVSVTPSISISNTPSVSVTPSISISNTPSVSVTPSVTPSTSTLSWTEYRIYGEDAGGLAARGVACLATNIPPSSPQTVYAATSDPFSVTQFYNTPNTSSPFSNLSGDGYAISFSTAADTITKYAGVGTTTGAISDIIAC